MYYLDGRWRHQSLVYFGNPGASSANVAAGHFREYVPRPHEMSYRSHWTISEPNDAQTAVCRVARELQKQQNGFLTLAHAAAATLTDPAKAK